MRSINGFLPHGLPRPDPACARAACHGYPARPSSPGSPVAVAPSVFLPLLGFACSLSQGDLRQRHRGLRRDHRMIS